MKAVIAAASRTQGIALLVALAFLVDLFLLPLQVLVHGPAGRSDPGKSLLDH
jgi:hypothetical protein